MVGLLPRRQDEDPPGDLGRLIAPDRSVRVASPLLIRNLLDEATGSMTVAGGTLARPLRLRPLGLAFEGGRRVLRARREDVSRLGTETIYSFLLHGGASVVAFESRCLRESAVELTLAVPDEVRLTGFRRSRRVTVAGARVSVASGEVLDASAGGLAVRRSGADQLHPGQRLSLAVELPGQILHAQAVVRNVAPRHRSGLPAVGLELVAFADGGARAWRRFVFRQTHPRVSLVRGRAREDWALLEASRYVELWTDPAARADLRHRHRLAWEAPDPGAGAMLQVERDGRPVGTVSATLVYPRCWMFHHLARDPGASQQSQSPLRDACELIVGLIDHMAHESDLATFVIYLEEAKRWNERLYFDFARNYWDPSRLSLTALQVYRRQTATAAPAGPVPVVPATRALLDRLSAALARTTSALVRTALGLDGALDLRSFSEDCARRGHERGRRIFFAGGAALVADSGDEGVNIFGLLNGCRLFALGEETPTAAEREALLGQAVSHYRALGKRHFLLFDQIGDGDGDGDGAPERMGFERVSAGLCWIAAREVLPAWSAYLEALIATRRPEDHQS
jgi:hypothetical protein